MEQSQIIKAVKKVLPAVVIISVSRYLTMFEKPFGFSPLNPLGDFFAVPKGKKKVKVGGGSGFIVDKSGIILTNRHVVADPQAEYVVFLGDKNYKVKILARDPINDVAILKIEDKELPVLKLGDSSKLELGQTAIAVGNALGTFQNTVSTGVISGLSREITAGDILTGQQAKLRGLIQTDAAINPGNSGGPLVDIEGKVIGINAAMVFGAENIGFALPINTAKKDLEDLKKYGKIRQPFLGVRYFMLDKEIQQRYSFPVDYGALVLSENIPGGQAVVPGGPAQKAGLREGDIILVCQNTKICQDNHLSDILNKCKVGEEIKLKVLRNGKEIAVKIVLEEKK